MNKKTGILYLIPSLIGGLPSSYSIPEFNIQVINKLKYFIVEEIKSAYKIMRKIGFKGNFEDVNLTVFNEHSSIKEIDSIMLPIANGEDVGILSEAGLPCIADPGNIIVRTAHVNNFKVFPLIGPNSIITALMASGLNGQSFSFHGYMPIKNNERESKIKQIEIFSKENNQTQIFIEAPYRNSSLLQALLKTCHPSTLLSLAVNINCEDEYIQTKSILEWKNNNLPDINKKPCVFSLLR